MALNINKKVASFGASVILVIGLITSGFVIEDRYNNQDDHNKDIIHEREIVDMKLEKVEQEVVMNLKQFQKSSDYKYYSQILETIDSQLYQIRQWMRQHPDDQEAKVDYNNLLEKRKKVKEKLDSLMEIN